MDWRSRYSPGRIKTALSAIRFGDRNSATHVDECQPLRDDGGDQTCQSTPDGAGHDIFAPGCAPIQWFSRLAALLDRRSAPRLAWLFLGALLARGRRTVTSWIRAAGMSQQYQRCCTTVAAAGKKAKDIATRLLCEVVKPLVAGQARLTLAIDDTPTQRYGPFVQGPGIHHNPNSWPGGLTTCLRPHLGGARALGGPSRLGSHRATTFGPNVCAS